MAVVILYLNLLPIAMRIHHVSPLVVAGASALVVPALLKHWVLDGDGLIVDRPSLLMVVFLTCIIMSSLFSKNIEISLPYVVRYVTQGLLLYLLLINLVRTRGALRRLAWVLVLCGGFLASLAVYQELTGSYTNEFGGLATRRTVHGQHLVEGPSAEPVTKSMRRAHGPDLDADRYAQILIVLLPLTWCVMRNEARLWRKVVAVGCAWLILGGVLLTYSRGAFLALVAMLGLMGVLRMFTARQAILAGAAAVVSMMVLSPGYVARLETMRGVEQLVGQTAEAEVGVDPVARNRATLMLVAWRVFLDHPILGVGPGQFARLYVIDYGAELYSRDVITRHFGTHSLYLELVSETGLVGFGIFLCIVISAVARLATVRRRTETADRFVSDVAAGTLVAITTYLVTGVFLHMAYQRYYWLLIALGGATVQVGQGVLLERVESRVRAGRPVFRS